MAGRGTDIQLGGNYKLFKKKRIFNKKKSSILERKEGSYKKWWFICYWNRTS